MIEGRMKNFYAARVLGEQPFVNIEHRLGRKGGGFCANPACHGRTVSVRPSADSAGALLVCGFTSAASPLAAAALIQTAGDVAFIRQGAEDKLLAYEALLA